MQCLCNESSHLGGVRGQRGGHGDQAAVPAVHDPLAALALGGAQAAARRLAATALRPGGRGSCGRPALQLRLLQLHDPGRETR